MNDFDYNPNERENDKDERDIQLIIISGVSILAFLIGTVLTLFFM